jgi:NAD(P)-dependent dehydrogenase (short-subunit alcohol dehydrogenase family)
MAGRLKDKVALVFGAGSIGPGWGNGKASAVAFAREGASVACVDIGLPAAEETAGIIGNEGGKALALACDVTKSRDVKAAVDRTLAAFGRIDILHNNVGHARMGGPVELTEAEWDRELELNIKGVFLACKHVLPVMLKQQRGSIINTSRHRRRGCATSATITRAITPPRAASTSSPSVSPCNTPGTASG